MLPRRVWVGLAIVTVFAVAFGSIPFVVKEVVRRTASARGIDVAIGDVYLRPMRVVLRGVSLRSVSGDVVRGELTDVAVRLDWRGAREVAIHGGRLELSGNEDALRAAFSARTSDGEIPRNSTGEGRRIVGEDLSVVWHRGNAEEVTLDGAAFQLDPTTLHFQATSLGLRGGRVAAQLKNLELSFGRADGQIESLEASGLDVSLNLSGHDQRWPASPSSPAPAVAAPSKDADSTGVVAQVFGLDATRGPRLREALARFTTTVARRLTVDHSVNLENVNLRVLRGDQSLNLGPVGVRLSRSAGQLSLRATPRSGARGPFGFELEIPLKAGTARASMSGGPIHLSELGIREGDFGLIGVDRAELRVESSATLPSDSDRLDFASHGSAQDIALLQQRLAPVPLTGMNFAWDASGSLELSGRALSIRNGEVSIGAVASRVDLSLTRETDRLTVDASFEVSRASCQKMFDSLPLGAVPLLEGSTLRGDFAWQAGVKFDTDHPLQTSASWRMANRCRFEEIPELAAPDRFRTQFAREVPGPEKEPMEVVSGPGSEDWVPLSEMPRYLSSAVLTTEDGGFWYHHGFDQRAIEGAIRQNLTAGGFQRGASTISMQLAKNLYLSRDKYVARKVQEALLTMLLEQEMQKEELLELYFNVIEYGPGIYGIGPAARHYFNSTPGELSIAQSFFLASILPNPKAEHFAATGALKPKWRAYLQQLMRIAEKRERLSEQELKDGLLQEVRLGVPNLMSNPYKVENAVVPNQDSGDWVPAPDAED